MKVPFDLIAVGGMAAHTAMGRRFRRVFCPRSHRHLSYREGPPTTHHPTSAVTPSLSHPSPNPTHPSLPQLFSKPHHITSHPTSPTASPPTPPHPLHPHPPHLIHFIPSPPNHIPSHPTPPRSLHIIPSHPIPPPRLAAARGLRMALRPPTHTAPALQQCQMASPIQAGAQATDPPDAWGTREGIARPSYHTPTSCRTPAVGTRQDRQRRRPPSLRATPHTTFPCLQTSHHTCSRRHYGPWRRAQRRHTPRRSHPTGVRLRTQLAFPRGQSSSSRAKAVAGHTGLVVVTRQSITRTRT